MQLFTKENGEKCENNIPETHSKINIIMKYNYYFN